jgi:hypothetical protein
VLCGGGSAALRQLFDLALELRELVVDVTHSRRGSGCYATVSGVCVISRRIARRSRAWRQRLRCREEEEEEEQVLVVVGAGGGSSARVCFRRNFPTPKTKTKIRFPQVPEFPVIFWQIFALAMLLG